jgi:hypothetical protein
VTQQLPDIPATLPPLQDEHLVVLPAGTALVRLHDVGGAQPAARQGYGFQFWMARHGYRGDGAFGQFCVVLPEHDTVVATTGGTEAMQAVLDHLWEHLLPGLGATAADEDSQHDLDRRLRGLRLAPCVARAAPPSWEAWTSAPFEALSADGLPASSFSSVELTRNEQAWQVTLT